MLLFSVRFSGLLLTLLVSVACHIAGHPMDLLPPMVRKVSNPKIAPLTSPIASVPDQPFGRPPIYPGDDQPWSLPPPPSPRSSVDLGDAGSILPSQLHKFIQSKMLNSEKVRKRCVKAFGPGLLEPPKLDVIHLSKAMEDAASTPSNWPKLSVFRDYVASLGSVDSPHKIAVSHVLHLAIVRDYLISEMDKTWIARSLLEWKNLFVELNDDRPFRTELETAMSFLSNLQSVDVRFPLLFLSKVRAPESQPIEFTTTDTDPISPGALMADDATAAASWLRYFQAQASSGLKAQAIDAFHNEIIRVSKQFKPESLGWHSTTVRTLEWLQFADLFSGSISAARLRWPHGHRKDRVAWSADTQIVGDFGIKTIAVLRNNFMLAPPHPNPSNSFILRVPNNELDEYNKMRLKIAFVTS